MAGSTLQNLPPSSSAGARVRLLLAAGVLLTATAGCGGGATAPAPEKSEASSPKATKSGGGKAKAAGHAGSKHVQVDADGRKWIGDIPYDVFYNDPLAVVADTQTVASKPAATEPAAPTPAAAEKPAAEPAKGGIHAWNSLLSFDQLQEETKRVRNHMKTSLQTQGTYNGNYKELSVDGAVLAAIAGIIPTYSEDTTWKANARYVRDFGLELSEAAKNLGKADFEKSQAAAEKITSIFEGSVPAGAADAAPQRPFSETASRWGVMKRIEKASEWMRANINSEAKMKAELEAIQHESAMIAAFGTIVADESYESAAEEDYQRFAKSLVEGAQQAGGGAKDQSFEKFRGGVDKIQKACQDCHASYGNG